MSEQPVPAPQTLGNLKSLNEEDRAWLDGRLVEYKDLFEFLCAD